MTLMMQNRPLGKTGIMVSALGYGAAGIGGAEAGAINSEELIGAAIAHRRTEFSIFTKIGHASGLPYPDWDARLVIPSIERSLTRLRTDRLDLVQIHTCSMAKLQDGELITQLQKARDAGKCRFIGFSGDGEIAHRAILSGAFDTIQTSISIADQQAIDLLLPEARKRGLGVLVKRPVANAVWLNGDQAPTAENLRIYWERLRLLDYPFLRTQHAAEKALRFTLSLDGVSTLLVHTSKPTRWLENAAHAALGPLPEAELAAMRTRWHDIAGADWVGQT
jgi:aryl-alcohol dehydrogenase-like predicted oxidoreductase